MGQISIGLGIGPTFAREGSGVATDPSFSSVKLLLGFNGTDAAVTTTDESAAPHTMTFFGNAQLDTAQKKFGTASLLLDGTGDYLSSADSADWAFGAGAFTIETWVRFNSVATDTELISQWDNSAALCSFRFVYSATNSLIFLFYDTGGTLRNTGFAWTPVVNTWYHVAVDRDGSGVVRLYVDGTWLGKLTFAQTLRDSTNALEIGRINHASPGYLNGWLDEIRITKGVARYASDSGFTAPAAAFPRSA